MPETDDLRIRADRLFDAALDLAPEERAAYLDEACDGDSELRRLVERLIASAELEETETMPGGGMQGPLWEGEATPGALPPGRARGRLRPPQSRGPPRHQAQQHPGVRRRPRQAAGLRHRQAAGPQGRSRAHDLLAALYDAWGRPREADRYRQVGTAVATGS